MLSSEGNVITYTNKKREKVTKSLTTLISGNPDEEIMERLHYTCDVLTHIISKNRKQSDQKHQNRNGVTSVTSTADTAPL